MSKNLDWCKNLLLARDAPVENTVCRLQPEALSKVTSAPTTQSTASRRRSIVVVARRLSSVTDSFVHNVSDAQISRGVRAASLLEWRRRLYSRPSNASQLVKLLRKSDEDNSVKDIAIPDTSDELVGGEDLPLLSFWLAYGRFHHELRGFSSSVWLAVRSVNIQGCNLPHDQCELLFISMRKSTPSLTDVDCSSNQVGGYADENDFFIPVLTSGAALAKLLEVNTSITSLKARYCGMGMRTVRAIAEALADRNRTLISMDIGANSLWWDEVEVDELQSDQCFSRDALDEVIRALRANYVLTKLVVSAAVLKPDHLCGRPLNSLPGRLRENPARINFASSRASRSDVIIITECVRRNPLARHFSLANTRIDREAAEAICDLMTDVTHKLIDIDLSGITCPFKVSRRLAAAALQHDNLKIFCSIPMKSIRDGTSSNLMLKGAHVGLHGAIVLASLLATNESVATLYVSENDFGTDGLIEFAKALRTNRGLRFIDMRQNFLQARALRAINTAIRERLDVKKLPPLPPIPPTPHMEAHAVARLDQQVLDLFATSYLAPLLPMTRSSNWEIRRGAITSLARLSDDHLRAAAAALRNLQGKSILADVLTYAHSDLCTMGQRREAVAGFVNLSNHSYSQQQLLAEGLLVEVRNLLLACEAKASMQICVPQIIGAISALSRNGALRPLLLEAGLMANLCAVAGDDSRGDGLISISMRKSAVQAIVQLCQTPEAAGERKPGGEVDRNHEAPPPRVFY